MKCTKCGNSAGEKDIFCRVCGNELIKNRFSELDINYRNASKNPILAKFGYSKNCLLAYAVGAVLPGIYLIIALVLCIMAGANIHIKVSNSQYIAFNDFAKDIASFLSILFLICLVIDIIGSIVVYKMCLCIYDNKIAGVAGKNMFLATEEFEAEYADIIDVKQKNNLITIDIGTKAYKCIIQDAKQAYEMIQSLL